MITSIPITEKFFYLAAGMAALVTIWFSVRPLVSRSHFWRAFREKRTLVQERDAAVEQASILLKTVRELRGLVDALGSRMGNLEQTVDHMRTDIARVTLSLRVALKYIKSVIEQNRLLRGIITRYLPELDIPAEPPIPIELKDAIHDVEAD